MMTAPWPTVQGALARCPGTQPIALCSRMLMRRSTLTHRCVGATKCEPRSGWARRAADGIAEGIDIERLAKLIAEQVVLAQSSLLRFIPLVRTSLLCGCWGMADDIGRLGVPSIWASFRPNLESGLTGGSRGFVSVFAA